MKRHSITVVLLAWLSIPSAGCGAAYADLNDTVGLWQAGAKDEARARCRREFDRFRDANGVDDHDVQSWAEALVTRLEEQPVLAPGERLRAPPSVGGHGEPDALDRGLRADLLSFKATPMTRALLVVRGLELHQHVQVVMAIIYARRVVEGDGGVLQTRDPAERTLTVKRIALDTLKALQ